MKKNLAAAIGVIGAFGALAAASASAQTNVQIYGIADVGIEYLTNAGGTPANSENLVRMASGNLSGSRIGFRGTEDLGSGLKAIFTLENGFEIDTGALAQGGRLFGRNAFVGLQSELGALTFGRQQNALYDLMIKYDPMTFSARYSALMHDANFTGRIDNTVKYTGNVGGFTATALYSFGRNQDGEVPGNSRVSRNIGAGLNYAGGPVGVGIAYDQFQGNTIATAGQSSKRIMAGASYDIGAVKLFGAYRWLKDEIVAAGTPAVRADVYWLGASYKAAPSVVINGAVYRTDRKGSQADPTSFVLSTVYSLSKRTDVYGNLGLARNKAGSNLGLSGVGSSIVAGENQTGVLVGVRHRF
jgi:predicted porin